MSRLLKRLRALNMDSFADYYDYLMSPEGQISEVMHMIDVVSTNKTEFFREPAHFDFLKKVALPELVLGETQENSQKIFVWSAGCSSGEEAYTLAIVIAEILEAHPGAMFSILATDISHRMLNMAEKAIYDKSTIKNIPLHYIYKYLMRGERSQNGFYRIVPRLRSCVTVKYLNLMESFAPIRVKMDFIFCRNVMIYFNRETRQVLTNKFYHQLKDGGYLFVGSSETLNGLDTKFIQAGPTIYRKI